MANKRITAEDLAAMGIHTEDGNVYQVKKNCTVTMPASSPKPLSAKALGLGEQTNCTVTMGNRRSKYNAQRTEVEGITFDSKKEAARWEELQLMLRAGEITELRRQVAFGLTVNGELVGTYKADYVYRDKQGKRVVEDVKGLRTDVYLLKRRLMLACHGIEVQEV